MQNVESVWHSASKVADETSVETRSTPFLRLMAHQVFIVLNPDWCEEPQEFWQNPKWGRLYTAVPPNGQMYIYLM